MDNVIICKECGSKDVMTGEPSENLDGKTTITFVCLNCGECWEN